MSSKDSFGAAAPLFFLHSFNYERSRMIPSKSLPFPKSPYRNHPTQLAYILSFYRHSILGGNVSIYLLPTGWDSSSISHLGPLPSSFSRCPVPEVCTLWFYRSPNLSIFLFSDSRTVLFLIYPQEHASMSLSFSSSDLLLSVPHYWI